MDKLFARINQLETIKYDMDERLSTLQQQLDQKEQEIQSIRNQIAENIFENTSDYMELQELYIVKRWLERLESEGGEDVDGQ
jgi:regulator of replication initiation timing